MFKFHNDNDEIMLRLWLLTISYYKGLSWRNKTYFDGHLPFKRCCALWVHILGLDITISYPEWVYRARRPLQ